MHEYLRVTIKGPDTLTHREKQLISAWASSFYITLIMQAKTAMVLSHTTEAAVSNRSLQEAMDAERRRDELALDRVRTETLRLVRVYAHRNFPDVDMDMEAIQEEEPPVPSRFPISRRNPTTQK